VFDGYVTTSGLWDTTDFTNPSVLVPFDMGGNDSHTDILGTFSSDVFKVTDTPNIAEPGELANGSTIDLFQYGLGFGNELVDAAAGTASQIPAGIYDTAITPFGDFLLF
jgi:hypothetical protein